MKSTIPFFKIGDIVKGEVLEVLDTQVLLVSFNGDLVAVSNQSRRDLGVGSRVRLEVTSVQPLQFRLNDDIEKLRLDRTI